MTATPDPWAVPRPEPTPHRLHPVGAIALAAVIGATGIVGRQFDQGFDGRALALGAIALLWATLIDRTRAASSPWALLVLPVAGAVAVAATASTSGRFPTLVLLGATLLAHAALVGPELLAGIPRRERPVAGLALAPLIGLQIAWFRSEPRVETVVLLGLSAALLVTFHLAASPMARAEAWLWRTLSAVGNAIATALIFVGVAIALYLPGLAVAGLDRLRRRNRTTTWREVRIDRREFARDAVYPFRSTEPRARDRRNTVGALVLAATVALVVVWPFGGDDGSTTTVIDRADAVRFSDLAAYEGVEFADALKAEQDEFSSSLTSDPRTGVGSRDFDGEFTTVSDGVRITPVPECDGCPTVRLWLLGGSAAFGLGQRDDHTIGAELARAAADDGVRLAVTNLAVPGWTIWQEYQALSARLTLTDERPDVVLFYDGYNDTVGTVIGSAVNGVDESAPSMLVTEEILAFTEQDMDPTAAGSADDAGGLAARRYESVARAADELAGAYGFSTAFFFQPDAYASPRQLAAVPDLFDDGDRSRSEYMDAALEAAATSTEGTTVNLRHLFDDLDQPVFADLVHTNEQGAALAAAAIYPVIAEEIAAAAR